MTLDKHPDVTDGYHNNMFGLGLKEGVDLQCLQEAVASYEGASLIPVVQNHYYVQVPRGEADSIRENFEKKYADMFEYIERTPARGL